MISFHYHERTCDLNELKAADVLAFLVHKEGYVLNEVSVVFCSDDYLLELNRNFLDHDYYTDILTFDYTLNKEVAGELFISIDRIVDNSGVLNVPINQELTRVLIHGFLHLCGYKDGTTVQKALMTEKEDYYLSFFG